MRRGAVLVCVFAGSLIVLGWGAATPGIATSYVDPIAKIQAQDEAFYGAISLEMARRGDWLTPRFLGRFALTKPPMLNWLQAGALKIMNRNLALRAPSLLAGAGTVTLVASWLVAQ